MKAAFDPDSKRHSAAGLVIVSDDPDFTIERNTEVLFCRSGVVAHYLAIRFALQTMAKSQYLGTVFSQAELAVDLINDPKPVYDPAIRKIVSTIQYYLSGRSVKLASPDDSEMREASLMARDKMRALTTRDFIPEVADFLVNGESLLTTPNEKP